MTDRSPPLSVSPLGIVTNCWRTQLAAGESLLELVAAAVRRGYRVIELRQTCLGEFETAGDSLPKADRLAALPATFPGVRFNVAIAVPFLQPGFARDDAAFHTGRWSAHAVAGEHPPHLRLVDPVTVQLADDSEAAGERIARLASAMAELDGLLSVEHSRQTWREFRAAFDAARRQLRQESGRLRLCYDPCNLLLPGDDVNPAEVTASLRADELAMVHAKQRKAGRPLEWVADGEIDWNAQAVALQRIGYRGPFLFEIEPHTEVWLHLDSSRRYLAEHGFQFAQCPR